MECVMEAVGSAIGQPCLPETGAGEFIIYSIVALMLIATGVWLVRSFR